MILACGKFGGFQVSIITMLMWLKIFPLKLTYWIKAFDLIAKLLFGDLVSVYMSIPFPNIFTDARGNSMLVYFLICVSFRGETCGILWNAEIVHDLEGEAHL